MGLLEIGLTIWAWKRGWRVWALLPLASGLVLAAFTALLLWDAGAFMVIAPKTIGFIVIDAAVIASLIWMVAKTRGKLAKGNTKDTVEGSEITPTTTRPPVNGAKLVLPNDRSIHITGTINPIGRGDFEGAISETALHYISAQHFWIRSNRGKYFLEDYNSANGTKLNGVEIKGKGLHLLHDGDKIDIGGIVVLTFKV